MSMTMELHNRTRNPPVTLDAAYAEQLQRLALAAMRGAPEVAERLLNEIERASIVSSTDLPADVVNIGSEVTFRDDVTGREQRVILVLPPDADISERRISVVTPIGAALLGLAEGASIHWETRAGETKRLTVTRVRNGVAVASAA